MTKTLFDKVWDSHVVKSVKEGPDVLFIDRHMVHEVTSPVAFLGLERRGLKVLYPNKTFATADHNTPTINQHLPVQDPMSAKQLKKLEKKRNIKQIQYCKDVDTCAEKCHLRHPHRQKVEGHQGSCCIGDHRYESRHPSNDWPHTWCEKTRLFDVSGFSVQ